MLNTYIIKMIINGRTDYARVEAASMSGAVALVEQLGHVVTVKRTNEE